MATTLGRKRRPGIGDVSGLDGITRAAVEPLNDIVARITGVTLVKKKAIATSVALIDPAATLAQTVTAHNALVTEHIALLKAFNALVARLQED